MIKSNKTPLLIVVLCGIFGLAGCESTPTTDTSNNSNRAVAANADKPANTTNSAANSANSAADTATVSTAAAIGVAECDDFIQKYEACINSSVPETARDAAKISIDHWRSSWRQMASNPKTKSTLAAACKNALESTKASTAAYNCKW